MAQNFHENLEMYVTCDTTYNVAAGKVSKVVSQGNNSSGGVCGVLQSQKRLF